RHDRGARARAASVVAQQVLRGRDLRRDDRAADQAPLDGRLVARRRCGPHRRHGQRGRARRARLERGAPAAADRIDSRLRELVVPRHRLHRRLLPLEMMPLPLLMLLVALPVVGALLLFVSGQEKTVRYVALGVSLVTFVLSLVLWMKFDA